ncbi:PDZ domain-containing protein [Loigolactobacillus zhaoyuanensis]|uniref:PDZ domain-containing protein n=1 Tax=Loigolactobacillus zhaoyuanensis TaxID=2486017 RepID=A0ABW8UBT7_9LACO|nr:PDZ domain-containing protein [Loigolactobacillus zhaoyuanensis]
MLVKLLISLVAQPLLWCAILAGYWVSRRRIQHERQTFHVAIDSRLNEFKAFFIYGIPVGIVLSVAVLLLGLQLPTSWLVGYQVVGILAVLMAANFVWPTAAVLLTTLLTVILLPNSLRLQVPLFTNQTLTNRNIAVSIFFLLAVSALGSAALRQRLAVKQLSPRIAESSRGRRTGYFQAQQLALVPLVFLVPGTKLTTGLFSWTTLQLAGDQYHLVILPLLIGFLLTVRQQLPTAQVKQQDRWQLITGVVDLISAGIVYFWPQLFLPLLLVVTVATFIGWLSARKVRGIVHYTEPFTGVMVLGIQPETPAAKMDLIAGDIILECNNQSVQDEDSFYAARMTDPTYCHLRVKTMSGDIKITESAIFADSPHNLGVMTFPEQAE